MSLDAEAFASALDALAARDVPPSRVDADRARSDGRRILRRRRAAAGLGATGAVALVVVLALAAGAGPGTGRAPVGVPDGSGPPMPRTTHSADWDPLVAPGTFGWLPANARNVNYSVAPGPGQGSTVLGMGSEISDGQVGHDAARIWLAALDPRLPAPKAGPLDDGSGDILIPAPDVNNRAAFWLVDPAKRDPDRGKAGTLYFQGANGRWAKINAYYLGADPVADTLLHVARTARIGDTAVPLPVRITGLPATATAPVAEVDRPTTISGATWSVGLTFNVADKHASINVQVLPATAIPAAGTKFGDRCRADDGLLICASAIGKLDPQVLPGGIDGLLRDITSLGADPAHWTTDVVVVAALHG